MPSLKTRIKLTNYCQNKCWYCSNDKKNKEEIEYETLYNILSFLQTVFNEKGYKRTKFDCTGGNPLTTQRSIDYIKLLNNEFKLNHLACLDVCYPTNIDRLKEYIDLGGWILLSLNEEKLSDIKHIIDNIPLKSIFVFNVVLTHYNLGRIDDIIDFVLKYNLPLKIDHLFFGDVSSDLINKINYTLDYKIFPKLINHYKDHKHNLIFGQIHQNKQKAIDYCGYSDSAFYFDIYGNIRRCQMETSICHINDKDWKDKFYKPLNFHDECYNCDSFIYCKGGCKIANKYKLYCEVYKKISNFIKELKE